ncbi:MAG: S-layer homology domain-containing protein [Clostridia bacterium]|nr:S-layer homology domain-containing protein [Clostridia bacterium]
MKKQKRWIACLLALCMACFALPAFAESASGAEALKGYGIMQGDTDGNLRLDDEITRAEATALIYRLHKEKDEDVATIGVSFPDMTGHWAAAEVACAKAEGLVDGTTETTFEPDKTVTLQEFLKMTVTLLGYNAQAERQGYPVGYMIVSTQLGLTKGITSAADANVTRGMAADILANALDVPLMKTMDDEDKTAYILMNGKDGTPLQTIRIALEAE